MEQLHLIVHKSMIEDELLSDLTPENKKPKLKRVLQRILEIESKEKHVKHVLFDNDDPNIPEGIHSVVDICQGYQSVRLYGISTTVCLPFCENRLKTAKFSVEYDTIGTIE